MQVHSRDVEQQVTLSAFPRSPRPETVASVGTAISMLIMLVGALVVVGWVFDIPALKSVLPNLSTMKPNTALAFVLMGASLRLSLMGRADRRARTAAQVLAGLVVLLALLTLGEYIFRWDLHIDEVLVKDTVPVISPPGRMGPNTAAAFVLAGLAVLGSHAATPVATVAAHILATMAAGLGLVALLGYAYSVKSLYGFASYTGMALHTAAATVALAIGILTIHPQRGIMKLVTGDTAGGLIVRRVLPGLIGIPMILGWLRLQGQHAGWYDTEFGTSLMVFSSIVTLGLVVSWTANSVQRLEAARTKTEEALREQRDLHDTVLSAQSDLGEGVVVAEGQRIIYANDAFGKIMGYARDEILALPSPWVMTAPEDRDRLADRLRRRLQGEQVPQHYETRFVHKQGHLIDVELAVKAIRPGETNRVVIIIRDISSRKQAETERLSLLEREQSARADAEAAQRRLAFLAEASRLLATSLDYQTTLSNVATAAVPGVADWCVVDMVGADRSVERLAAAHVDPAKAEMLFELQRRYPHDPTKPGWGNEVFRTNKSVLVSEIPETLVESASQSSERLRIIRSVGNPKSLIITPIIVGARVVGLITLVAAESNRRYSAEDVAMAEELARRAAMAIENAMHYREAQVLNLELERRVADRTAQLESANQELEAFSYSVAHDLRAPLRAMDGFSRLVVEDYAARLPEEGQRHLHLVRENAQQMARLIDDLLAFSRLGRQPLNKQHVNVAGLVRRVVEDLRPDYEGRDVTIQIGELPDGDADPTLLRQVFANLLSNALKFTRSKEAPRIEVHSRTEGTEPVYVVKDNGVGFDMQYKEKLFRVFQRLHRAEDYEGTGVGLAIVQRIVARHGGRVWAEAQPDKGATFYFTLGGHPDGDRSSGNPAR